MVIKMKKIAVLLTLTAITLSISLSAKQIFEFDGKNTNKLSKLTADGKISKKDVIPIIDGKSALVFNDKTSGAQTILATIEYKDKPSKIIFVFNSLIFL